MASRGLACPRAPGRRLRRAATQRAASRPRSPAGPVAARRAEPLRRPASDVAGTPWRSAQRVMRPSRRIRLHDGRPHRVAGRPHGSRPKVTPPRGPGKRQAEDLPRHQTADHEVVGQHTPRRRAGPQAAGQGPPRPLASPTRIRALLRERDVPEDRLVLEAWALLPGRLPVPFAIAVRYDRAVEAAACNRI